MWWCTGYGQIAKYLIVGAILFDNVKHILDGTRKAESKNETTYVHEAVLLLLSLILFVMKGQSLTTPQMYKKIRLRAQ